MDLLLRRRQMIAAQSNDIVEVPYVRTNSGAYIDTGLRGYSSTTVDISFKMNRAYTSSSGHIGVFGFEQSSYSGQTDITYYPGFAVFISNSSGTSSWFPTRFVKFAQYGHDTDSIRTTSEYPWQANGEYNVVVSRTGCTISGSYSHTYTWESDAWSMEDSDGKSYYNYQTHGSMSLGCTTYYARPAGYTNYGYFVTYVDVNIYHCKIWQGNSLKRDYVPAFSRSENKYGFYDRVNGTFSASLTSTGFTYQ